MHLPPSLAFPVLWNTVVLKIQILDLPGLIKGAAEGKGRGREILNVIRSADMVLYIVDPFQDAHFNVLHRELHNAGSEAERDAAPSVHQANRDEAALTFEDNGGTNAPQRRRDGGHHPLVWLHLSDCNASETTPRPNKLSTVWHKIGIYEKAVIAINKIDIAYRRRIGAQLVQTCPRIGQ